MERGRFFCFLFFVFKLRFSLVFRACFLFLQITKKTKNKNKKKLFPHNGVRSWLAYPESLRFQIFSLFLICRDRTRCTAKSIRSREDKKHFPRYFWFAAIAQGARQRPYAVRENNSPRLKQKRSNNKLIKYERFKKKNPPL